jgi:hypothetical protein
MGYSNDRAFSDRFVPQIRTIVGPYLLCPASLEQDRHEACDLTILRGRDMMIACRIRRPGYDNFARQFTIRSEREEGAKTELQKIIEGFGDWLFYGHAASDLSSIVRWMLIDLSSFRAHLILNLKTIRRGDQRNPDGTWFRWYEVDSFPADPPLLIAEHVPEEDEVPF